MEGPEVPFGCAGGGVGAGCGTAGVEITFMGGVAVYASVSLLEAVHATARSSMEGPGGTSGLVFAGLSGGDRVYESLPPAIGGGC